MYLVNRYIGAPIKRVEDHRFLRGRGEYVADLTGADALHAAILRSPVAHARIRAIDPTSALAIGGVRAVITAAEIGTVPRIPLRLQSSPATEPFCQQVIARDRVRYVGEPIAVVLADNAALAEDGVDAITLDIVELPIVADRYISQR
jgi:carbon-monoxide dehydrogenase large subunit